ncbi:MAG TPA: YbaK/EbsC family protein [Polyangia bacterium]
MRRSHLFAPTLKEAPPEARGAARALLWRGGFLRREALLPLGARVRARLAAMARQELAAIGVQEARGARTTLRELLRREIRSPKQLPQALFSVGDELTVAVAGTLPIEAAIAAVVARGGVTTTSIAAAPAGGAHALVAASDDGDDSWLVCDGCGFGALDEAALLRAAAAATTPAAAVEPLAEVHTPGASTIAEVATFFGGGAVAFVKTLVYVTDDNRPLMALVRGDRAVEERKLCALAGVDHVRLAADAVVRDVTGAEVGFAGAHGRRVPVYADVEVAALPSAITGANRTDHHVRGFNLGRDVPDAHVGDLRRALVGDGCGHCERGQWGAARGFIIAEAGGDGARLSFDALVAACVAQHHDGDGVIWPRALAPFDVCVLALGDEPEIADAAAALADELGARGLEVLLDDRDERAGAKFKDADLSGIPERVTVGKRALAEGAVEHKRRGDKEATMIPRQTIVDVLVRRVRGADA